MPATRPWVRASAEAGDLALHLNRATARDACMAVPPSPIQRAAPNVPFSSDVPAAARDEIAARVSKGAVFGSAGGTLRMFSPNRHPAAFIWNVIRRNHGRREEMPRHPTPGTVLFGGGTFT